MEHTHGKTPRFTIQVELLIGSDMSDPYIPEIHGVRHNDTLTELESEIYRERMKKIIFEVERKLEKLLSLESRLTIDANSIDLIREKTSQQTPFAVDHLEV